MSKKERSLASAFDDLDIDAEELDIKKEPTKEKDPNQTNQNDFNVLNEFKQKVKKRKTVEETHVRETFLIDKELRKRVDRIARKQPRGFKTFFYNKVIEAGLRAIEESKRNDS